MTSPKIRDHLAAVSLFHGLPDQQLEAIAALTREKHYNRGETIFFEGDPGDGFYLIVSGQVKVFKMNLMGKEQILHIFGAGEPIGEVAVFHGQPFPASAETLMKSTLLFLPRREFVQLIERHAGIALNMLAVLSLRLRQFTAQIENLSLKEVPARLAGYLLVASEEQQNGDVVELEISKGQLASLLGTIPETLSRIFARMSEDGLIRVDGRTITILDRDGLAEL
ncbi:Crp/Fnr family transcriptional regulator [Desulfofustis limnaeus]|jgi:CRP/FNR family transcriptional regulator|uniref:Transcriptional regulator n=1 Tax=Desulfofustis limnaeus TaxID=2740163 RepID=A0ABM7W803_9BACT|nr:Crp/Fnr family transcriptional regulator [Desulfofustis limnaeus]MDX9894552.1 Crp/Fnr family transcriptional regulator [Desulfofustis sp.]BDD87058.1 transcriptional regulator [Desulfofustis limnaeus]